MIINSLFLIVVTGLITHRLMKPDFLSLYQNIRDYNTRIIEPRIDEFSLFVVYDKIETGQL